MAVIKSISISEKQSEIVKKYGLSCSALLQKAIDEVELYNTGGMEDMLSYVKARNAALQAQLERKTKFIEDKGLNQEYNNVLFEKNR